MRTVDLAPSEVVAVLIQGSSDHSAARDTHIFVRKGAAGLTGHPGSSQVTGKRTDVPRPEQRRHRLPAPRRTSSSDTSDAVAFRSRAISRWGHWHRPGQVT